VNEYTLTEDEVYAIMQSDIKLWERASTEQKGDSITKRMFLPFGIGEVAVEFQGVNNGITRRGAAEQWGGIIRDRVKERIDDEAITARAQLAAALRASEVESEGVGNADSGHSDADGPTVGDKGEQTVLQEAGAGAVQAHAVDAQDDDGPGGTDFAARAEWLRGKINKAEASIRGWRRELKALEAALSVLEGEDE